MTYEKGANQTMNEKHKVCLIDCADYEQQSIKSAITRIFRLYGGADGIVALAGNAKKTKNETNVLIKPNLVMPCKPEEAVTTHPMLVRMIAEEFVSAGYPVTITDSSGEPHTQEAFQNLYDVTGMTKAAEHSGAKLSYDITYEDRVIQTKLNDVAKRTGKKEIPVLKAIAQADVIINVAKLKTHGTMFYTGAVKNMYGSVFSDFKQYYHDVFPDKISFAKMVTDICACMKPTLSIIDGIDGMDSRGPTAGKIRHAGVLIASENPHAADLAAARVIGFSPGQMPIMMEGIKRKYIPRKAKKLKYFGEPPDRFAFKFVPAMMIPAKFGFLPVFIQKKLNEKRMPYPAVIQETCTGCGKCLKICPCKTMAMKENRVMIHYENCIRCYCCHELCPARAVTFIKEVKYANKNT